MSKQSAYRIKNEEIETAITVDYMDKSAYVYTNYKPMKKRLNKLVQQYPDQAVIDKEDDIGIFVCMPINWVKIQPRKERKEVSEERKQQLIARLNRPKEDT